MKNRTLTNGTQKLTVECNIIILCFNKWYSYNVNRIKVTFIFQIYVTSLVYDRHLVFITMVKVIVN